MQLFMRILRSTVIGLLVSGALIFIPAGTVAYWQGWTFIAVFSISNLIIGLYLALKDPALLERRKKVGPAAEKRLVQKIIISLCFVIFLLLVVFSVLDWRFGWSHVAPWISVLGDALVALGLMFILRVFRENSYGASTIEKMEGGPLALGSWWGLLFALLTVPVLVVRILDEEKMLFGELEGYEAYARNVRYRLVPGVW